MSSRAPLLSLLVAGLAVCLAAQLCGPATANAWEVSNEAWGAVSIEREPGDTTGTVDVLVYDSYLTKPSAAEWADGTWNNTDETGSTFKNWPEKILRFEPEVMRVQFPVVNFYQLVVTPDGESFFCARQAQRVSIVNSQTGGSVIDVNLVAYGLPTGVTSLSTTIPKTAAGVPVSAGATLPVSVDSSVTLSLDESGTVPVSIRSIGSTGQQVLDLVGWIIISVSSGLIGFSIADRLSR